MNEIKYVDIADCKSQGNSLKAVCFKPKKAPLICLILGVLLMIPNNIYVRLLGVFFIFMSFLVIKLVRDFKVMDIFDKGIMFYGDEEAKTAYFLPFEEMESWIVRHENGHDTIEVKTKNGEMIIKDSFEADKAYKALYSLVREKDEKYIQALKNREHELSIPDAFNNIKRSFRKK